MNTDEERELRKKIAYNIRAELVCCDMYDRVQKYAEARGFPDFLDFEDIPGYHAICHWGECAARIAENPTRYGNVD